MVGRKTIFLTLSRAEIRIARDIESAFSSTHANRQHAVLLPVERQCKQIFSRISCNSMQQKATCFYVGFEQRCHNTEIFVANSFTDTTLGT